jgi:hypothetical protein
MRPPFAVRLVSSSTYAPPCDHRDTDLLTADAAGAVEPFDLAAKISPDAAHRLERGIKVLSRS